MENCENDLRTLRDRIASSLARLQMMEDAADVMMEQAVDSGYRSGWYDGIMTAVEELRSLGFKSAAEIVERAATLAELRD